MELTFLGTAAANAYPEAFCRCANCEHARALGGPSLRKRSAALINDDLLLTRSVGAKRYRPRRWADGLIMVPAAFVFAEGAALEAAQRGHTNVFRRGRSAAWGN